MEEKKPGLDASHFLGRYWAAAGSPILRGKVHLIGLTL